jgi:uncharacterized protein (TIGR02421 family)
MKTFVDYKSIDQKISEISQTFNANTLFYITPQNVEEEKEKFFSSLKEGEIYNPKFIYPSKNPLYSYFSMKPDFEIYRKDLSNLIERLDQDSLGILCENKILDLFEKMELVKSIGTPNFVQNAEEFYGSVDKKTLKLAIEQLKQPIKKTRSKKMSQASAKKKIQNFLKKNNLSYTIVFRDHSTSRFSVHPKSKTIYISNDTKFDDLTLKRLIGHEIETHLYRYENGLLQPYSIFSQGTSKTYAETEEGLAVNVERLKGLGIDEQLKNYAGRVLAIHVGSKKSFYETFEELTQFFNDEEAFRLTLRAKRGAFKQSEGGAFTKDLLYFKGKFLVEKFLEENKIEDLYYGKYGVEETYLVKNVAGIKKPKFLPKGLKNVK